MVIVVM